MQISILVGILNSLLAKRKTSATELSVKFEISTRSVMRYIDALNEGGVPVVSYRGKNGGYGILENFRLAASFFTNEEYEKIIFAIDSVPKDNTTLSIKDKLSGLKKADKNIFDTTENIIIATNFSPAFENKYNALFNAIKNSLLTEITYMDKFGLQTSRNIQPEKLVFSENEWYVFAFCHMRKDFRFFKLNRIVGIKVLEQTFVPQKHKMDMSQLNSFLKAKEQIDISLQFSADILVGVQEWLGEESIIKKGSGFLAFARVPYDEFLIHKIINFGNKVKVIKPLRLQTDIVKYLLQVYDLYKNS